MIDHPDPCTETVGEPAPEQTEGDARPHPLDVTVTDASDHDSQSTILSSADPDATVGFTPSGRGQTPSDSGEKTVPDEGAGHPKGRPARVAGYEILGLLGRGGMGVVYRARQPGLKRTVALKMILAGGHGSDENLDRFRREAEAVAALQHPNIVQIHEVGEEEGRPFFSLEFVDGESLAKKCAGAPQPPVAAARLVRTLALAMERAHRQGVIHRDLKPANILLTSDGVPKISDFGLAKRLDDDSAQTRSGSIMGTPSYMAPEQAEGRNKDVGPLADVYALGAILYELLTGRAPFRAATVYDTLHQVRSQEPVAPSQLQPKLPIDVETICLKCLQKDPARRYASAEALADDLGRFLDGAPILARPVGSGERLWRWCRRNPRLAGLSAAIALLLAVWSVSASLLTWRLAHEKEATARARDEARANASAAERNAVVARSSEARANDQTAQAERNAKRARRGEDLARTQETQAKKFSEMIIQQMILFDRQVQRRLSARPPGATSSAELRQARRDVSELLRQDLLRIAKQIDSHEETLFSVAVCQHLGDHLKTLGAGQDALQQYERGVKIIERYVLAHPDDDMAEADRATMLMRQGDVALDLACDALAARGYYTQAWAAQQKIARSPHGQVYSAVDHLRLGSHYAVKAGVASLRLGAPVEARDWLQKALEARRAWLTAEPSNVSALSYVSEAELWMGVACSHLADRPAIDEHFREALRICNGLVQRFPNAFDFKSDLATVSGEHGDALLRLGAVDDARAAYETSLRNSATALAHIAEDAGAQALFATAHERLAALALRVEKPAEAEGHYREALKAREELAGLEPRNLPWQAAWALALAHCGQLDAAAGRTAELRPQAAGKIALLIEVARCEAVCASRAEGDSRKRYVAVMLDALKAAVKEGYKDVVVLRTDPDLGPFREDAAFQAILEEASRASRQQQP